MNPTSDVLVIGTGSVGLPIALACAQAGLRVTVVDREASAGRGEHCAAIGGIRASHSEPAKIALALEAREIFAGWQERTGTSIGWRRGGYLFTAYSDEDARRLQTLIAHQRNAGLSVEWIDSTRVQSLAPGIARAELRGACWSPEDGAASPLRFGVSCWESAAALGARFVFHTSVTAIRRVGDRVLGVDTTAGAFDAPTLVLAAGAAAGAVGAMAGITLPVVPESHEAGITEPVSRFLEPLVIDLRAAPGSKNVYFYQDAEGQVVFCLTPDPAIPGTDRRSTSAFLPLATQRLVSLMPRLRPLRIRRVWRGLYPMSPDGLPFVGFAPECAGLFIAAGLCGQGFMLGPGIAMLTARVLTGRTTETDRRVLADLRPDRSFAREEVLK